MYTYVFRIITYGVVTDPFWMPFMDEAEDGAEEDVEDTEDEPTSLIALFLKKTKIKAFLVINKKVSIGLHCYY